MSDMADRIEVPEGAEPADEGGVDEMIIPFILAHLQANGLPTPEEAPKLVAYAQALVDAIVEHAEADDA